jgi:hypothetical protein
MESDHGSNEDDIDNSLLRKKIQRVKSHHFESPENLVNKKPEKTLFNKFIEDRNADIGNIRQLEDNSPIVLIRKEIESLEVIDRAAINEIVYNLLGKDLANHKNSIYERFYTEINYALDREKDLKKSIILNYIVSYERYILESKLSLQNYSNNIQYLFKSSPCLTPRTGSNSGKTFYEGIQSTNLDLYNNIMENSPYPNLSFPNYNMFNNIYMIASPLNIHGYSPMVPPSPFTTRNNEEQPVKQTRGGFTDLVKNLCYKTNK